MLTQYHPTEFTKRIEIISPEYVKPFTNFTKKISVQILKQEQTDATCELNGIMLYTDQINTIDELHNLMKGGKLEIEIGGAKVFMFDFELLMELNNVIKSNNIYIIKIPSEWTTKDILIGCLQFSSLVIKLDLPNANLIDDVKLCTNYCSYDTNSFQTFIHTSHELPISQITELAKHEWINNSATNITLNLNAKSFVKGYLIEGDISKINTFCIMLNGRERFKPYDNILLQTLCYKISNNLHYFSYINQNNLKDSSITSYVGALNCSSIDDIRLILQLLPSETLQQLKIYSVGFNILKYINGKASQIHSIYPPI